MSLMQFQFSFRHRPSNTSNMPPKKTQNKEPGKKTTKCNFNNRGYCKLKEQCEKEHSDENCENFDCNEEDCSKRHLNPCKFGPRCKFNKKNECM